MSDERQSLPRVFTVGDWEIDGNSLTASRDGESRTLEPKAYQVLRYLCDRPGELVTIDELMDTQWAGTVVTPNAVSRVIAQLRKVLHDDAKNPRYIETVARTGYRCIAAASDVETRKAKPRRAYWAVAAIIAALVVVLIYIWPGKPAEPTVAVLPFQNMTGDPEKNYIGDGVAEEIINSLSRNRSLRVRPQLQSFRFRDADKDLAEIARELDATYIVTGSVRMSGQSLRLSAQLIDPVSGENIESVTEEYGVLQLFDGQDAISRAVAASLADAAGIPAFAVDEASGQPDAQAYDLYLRGRHTWHRRGSEPLQPAIDYFREAVQIDPEFGRGWAALAMAYLTYPSYSPRGYATWNDAEPAAQKALELDPEIAGAYGVLATFAYTRFEWARAEELFLESLRLDPQGTTANYWYAQFLEIVGKHAESVGYLRQSIELDPTYRPPRLMLAITHMNFRDHETAAGLMLDVWQSGHSMRVSWMLNFMNAVYTRDVDVVEEWLAAGPDDEALVALLRRFVDVHMRRQPDAALIADMTDHFWRRPDYMFGIWLLGQLGGHDEVFALLNNRLDKGRQLDTRPFWAPENGMREDPAFVQLLNRIGLIDYWDRSGWGSVCVREGDAVDCSGKHMTPELLRSLLAADSAL